MMNFQTAYQRIALLIPIILLFSSHDLAAGRSRARSSAVVPAITLVTVAPAAFGPGETVDIIFTTTAPFNQGNVFTAQLSNMVGDFSNPRILGALQSTSQGVISVQVPCEIGPGTGFRIRVISSAPRIFGPDNGVPLTVKSRPIFEVTAMGPTTFCPGGSVTLVASPGYAYYRWNTNDSTRSIVARATGIYTVYVYDSNGCGLVNRATVEVHAPPSPPIRLTNGVVLETDFGYITYQWFLDSIPIPDSNWPTRKASAHGTYFVLVSDTNGCYGRSPARNVGVADVDAGRGGGDVQIRTSPQDDRVTVRATLKAAATVSISMSDINGRILERHNEAAPGGAYVHEMSLSELPAGVYLVQAKIGERVVVEKIVKGGR